MSETKLRHRLNRLARQNRRMGDALIHLFRHPGLFGGARRELIAGVLGFTVARLAEEIRLASDRGDGAESKSEAEH